MGIGFQAYGQLGAGRIIYVTGDGWYLEARGGLQGPYLLREHAERRLQTLLLLGPGREVVWTDAERRAGYRSTP